MKNAYQSHTVGDMGASKAVDGMHDTTHASSTGTKREPWWYVDLGQEYTIGNVAVTNCIRARE